MPGRTWVLEYFRRARTSAANILKLPSTGGTDKRDLKPLLAAPARPAVLSALCPRQQPNAVALDATPRPGDTVRVVPNAAAAA